MTTYNVWRLRPTARALRRNVSLHIAIQLAEQHMNRHYPNQWERWNDGMQFGIKGQPGTPLAHVTIVRSNEQWR